MHQLKIFKRVNSTSTLWKFMIKVGRGKGKKWFVTDLTHVPISLFKGFDYDIPHVSYVHAYYRIVV